MQVVFSYASFCFYSMHHEFQKHNTIITKNQPTCSTPICIHAGHFCPRVLFRVVAFHCVQPTVAIIAPDGIEQTLHDRNSNADSRCEHIFDAAPFIFCWIISRESKRVYIMKMKFKLSIDVCEEDKNVT